MTETAVPNHSETDKINTDKAHAQSPKFDMFATGLITGIAVTTIVETGKGALGMLVRNPLVVLGTGIATGYFAHKYRKEIIVSSQKITEHSKDFVSRQKKDFNDMFSDIKKEDK